jgi:signal peptidase II
VIGVIRRWKVLIPDMQNKYIRLVVVGGLVVILDQLTKYFIVKHVPLHTTVPVLQGLFDIIHIKNPGGAFGLLANLSPGMRTFVFLFISSLAVGLILYFYIKTPLTQTWLAVAFALIFGGAIGNLVDRIRFGVVTDFLDFYIGNYHWPAFNIADSAISIGIGIFIYHLLFKKIPD